MLMIFFHAMMYFIGVMGFGGRTGNESLVELVFNLLLFSLFGAAPNLVVFLISYIRKKDVKRNLLWAESFSLLVIIGYFIMFSPILF